jgi:hypothetical protein
MNTNGNLNPDDLVLYAMQLLSPEETAIIRQGLKHDQTARQELAAIYTDLALVAGSVETHDAPPLARERLLRDISRERKVVSIDNAKAAPIAAAVPAVSKAARSRVLPWVGWAVAAGMALEVANLYQQRAHLRVEAHQAQVAGEQARLVLNTVSNPKAAHALLTAAETRRVPQGRASYVAETGSLVFLANNLEPLEPEKAYELWLIPVSGAPIAAGVFRPDEHGNASVLLPLLPKGTAAKAFGVTIEDAEGSAVPTSPIVLKGVAG